MTPSGQIYVIRHGQTAWSARGCHTGRTDIDLTEEGVTEARALRVLADRTFVEVRSSPLTRARRTAEIAGFGRLTLDVDLMEWDYGGYEGLTTPEVVEKLGRPWSVWADGVPPGDTPGETVEDVGERVDRVLAAVTPRLEEGDVALIAHAHSLRVLTARWLGLPPAAGRLFRMETASYGVLGFEHDRHVMHRWSARD